MPILWALGKQQLYWQTATVLQVESRNFKSTKRQSGYDTRSRSTFFHDAQLQIEAVCSYQQLKRVCRKLQQSVKDYQLTLSLSLAQTADMDVNALGVMTEQQRRQFLPVTVQADGNCFFRSMSMFLFGEQTEHEECRVRVTVEMLQNEPKYTNPNDLAAASGDDPDRIRKFLELLSAGAYNASFTLKDYFKSEVMETRKCGISCGTWQMFAAANFLRCPIVSIYPELGEAPIYQQMNCIIKPTCAPNSEDHEVAILWTSTRSDLNERFWIANHVIPLIPSSGCQSDAMEVFTQHADTGYEMDEQDRSSRQGTDASEAGNTDVWAVEQLLDNFYKYAWEVEKQDYVELEFLDYQTVSPDTIPQDTSVEDQWAAISSMKDSNGSRRFKLLPRVIASILLIPVSNCSCERVFSQVRKNKTDFRASMGSDQLETLLVLKTRMNGVPCYDTTLSDEVLKKCKRATRAALSK